MQKFRSCFIVGVIAVLPWQAILAQEERPIRFAWFVDFDPTGKQLLTSYGGWDKEESGEIRIWDIDSGEAAFTSPNDRGNRCTHWSKSGDLFASGSYAGYIRVFKTSTKQVLHTLRISGAVEAVEIAPNEDRIVACSGNGMISIWNLKSGERLRFFPAHEAEIWDLAISPDSRFFATAGRDSVARVWNLETGERLYKIPHPNNTNGVAFSPDSKLLATGCWDRQIRIFDLSTGDEVQTISGHDGYVLGLDFSTEGDILISGSTDGTIRIWDWQGEQEIATIPAHQSHIHAVKFSPDGTKIASSSWDGTVKLWDVLSKTEIAKFER